MPYANKQINALQPQQFFSDWLEGFQNLGGGSAPKNWQESIDIIERQIGSVLDAQVKTMKSLIATTDGLSGIPEPFMQWFQRMEQSIELCGDMQQRLWEAWFDMLRSTTSGVKTPGTIVIGNWQEMMDHAVSIQEQLLNQFTGIRTVPEKAPRKKRVKSSAPGKSTAAVSSIKTK